MRFYIVDVFAQTRYSGNQLAVFRDTQGLSTAEMQKIAQEMHFSETTFITSEEQRNGGYDVRVFTPDFELPFAGHPTLGTAFVIQSQIIRKQVPVVNLNLKVGQIPVSFTYEDGSPDVMFMRQKEPTFGKAVPAETVARPLGLRTSDIDAKFPVMVVSTGIPFAIVPLKSLASVRKVRLDVEAATKALKELGSLGFLVFSPETYERGNDLNVRVLGPPPIPEDPATGSGNGCLAAYLLKNRYFSGDYVDSIDLRVEQGYEIRRKSLLLLRARKQGRHIEVNVGGRVQFIASGESAD